MHPQTLVYLFLCFNIVDETLINFNKNDLDECERVKRNLETDNSPHGRFDPDLIEWGEEWTDREEANTDDD